MGDTGTMHADDLIAQARRDLGETIADGDLLAACEAFHGHGFSDRVSGDVESPEGHFYRVHRWIVATDSNGFRYLDEYDSEAEARREFGQREERNARWYDDDE